VTLRDLFLLDPGVVYLNHGSFGACPKPVFDVYQEWQRELERQPVRLLARRLQDELGRVRAVLGEYVGAAAEDLALVPNATFAMNAVLRSLPLEPGDEILTSEHEYGAVELLLEFVSKRTGARIVRRSAHEIWAGASERTRVIVVSHVTSPTALLLPVEELCRAARAAGVLTLVDGAHAAGHVPLALEALGADFYAGNCHKWMYSPKGAGFLHALPERHALLEPLVVSWGAAPDSSFAARHGWHGTRDPAAYLALPSAIEFLDSHGRGSECAALLRGATARLKAAGCPPFAPDQGLQMAAFCLPECEPATVQRAFLEGFGIEVPVQLWRGRPLLRVSVATYNTKEDLQRLEAAVEALVPECARP
jgi:isopenicillin-N epimerase